MARRRRPINRIGLDTVMSREVISIRYIHAHNGQPYEHEFEKGVHMTARFDGTIVLSKRGVDLFAEYPDEE